MKRITLALSFLALSALAAPSQATIINGNVFESKDLFTPGDGLLTLDVTGKKEWLNLTYVITESGLGGLGADFAGLLGQGCRPDMTTRICTSETFLQGFTWALDSEVAQLFGDAGVPTNSTGGDPAGNTAALIDLLGGVNDPVFPLPPSAPATAGWTMDGIFSGAPDYPVLSFLSASYFDGLLLLPGSDSGSALRQPLPTDSALFSGWFYEPVATPEPASLSLLGPSLLVISLLGMLGRRTAAGSAAG